MALPNGGSRLRLPHSLLSALVRPRDCVAYLCLPLQVARLLEYMEASQVLVDNINAVPAGHSAEYVSIIADLAASKVTPPQRLECHQLRCLSTAHQVSSGIFWKITLRRRRGLATKPAPGRAFSSSPECQLFVPST